jgi:ABC-2 type transport system ATP-binding protein
MKTLEPTISARRLSKKFGDFTAVDRVNFDIYPGEIFGFLGPNGSGKTTTIRMTLGLLHQTDGSISVLGMNVNSDIDKIRPQVGYMSQKFSLYNDLSVIQNLKFYGSAYGISHSLLAKRIDDAISLAGLEGNENTKTKELAGGWRQRLALGAAILHQPKVIFLDEPTAGVDPVSRRAFWDLLYKLVAEKITVFVTTHYMDEAEHCHRIAFIQQGKIIAYGSPNEIKREKMIGQVLEIYSSDPIKTIKILRKAKERSLLNLLEIELHGSSVHVIAQGIHKLQQEIDRELRKAGILDLVITVIEPSLEDVFISSMKQEPEEV